MCVREKESETLSVRQTGKPTDCYRQALARGRGMASEEGKGKEREGKRGKVFGHRSSRDKRTTRNRDTREGCGAKHLAAKVDMVELAAVGRRCCCCIGPKTRGRGCTQAIGESIINEGIESDCTLLGDDEALS